MDAYESLNRVRARKVEYDRLLNKVEYLTALAERTTAVLSGMPRASAKHGQSDETWASLADYRSKCEEKLDEYVRQCVLLEEELTTCIKSVRVRTAMHYRYVDLMSVSDIASNMAINERNAYRFLKRGRIMYERYYDEMHKKGDNNDERRE